MEGDTPPTVTRWARAGNQSMIHVDLMVGSGEMDVDGITEEGVREPLMRRGEWTFEA